MNSSLMKVLAVAIALATSLLLQACGGGGGGPAVGGGERGGITQRELTAAGLKIIEDPSKLPEPSEGAVGWIAPEDLTATPKRGGVLRTNGTWTRLDSHFPLHPGDGVGMVRQYASGILKWDLKTNSPTLDLAESWQEAPDKLSYTFKIRKGVKFHNLPPVNGRELKAEDVKWSLDRVSGLSRQPGQVSFNYGRFWTLKEVQVVDDYTVKVVLKQPDNMFLRELMHEFTIILPKEAMIDGQFGDGKTLIGTGPFIVDVAVAGGTSKFKRNPDYFAKGPKDQPYLDAVEWYTFSNVALAPAFKTRQLDRVSGGYADLKPLLNDAELKREVRIYDTRGNLVGITGVSFNANVPPLTDIRVRQAINLAINRDEIRDLAYGGPGGGYIVGFIGGYWQPWFWSEEKLRTLPGFRQPKDQDLAEAKRLLAEAGFASGLTITCECENQGQADVLVQQMKRVGITMKINLGTGGVIRFTNYMRDKQISDTTQGSLNAPDSGLTQSFLCDSPKNQSALCDQEVEKMWREFRASFDEQQAAKILDRIQQRLWDIMAFAPTVRLTSYHVYYKYVRGWRYGFNDAGCCPAHGHDFINWWLDR